MSANPSSPQHRQQIETLYRGASSENQIDCWALPTDEQERTISNLRHLDPTRARRESDVWRTFVHPGARVLDLACGRGFFARRFKDAVGVPTTLVGLDISAAILERSVQEQTPLLPVVGDAQGLPFGEATFDVVLMISAIEQTETPQQTLEEIHRVLRPGGYFYLVIHKPAVDPLVVPTLFRFVRNRLPGRKRPPKANRIGHGGSLRSLRRDLQNHLNQLGMVRIREQALMVQFDWWFYRWLAPRFVPFLISLLAPLNRLPFSYCKDLEYWLVRRT
jgi:ubiquinone/menaquinone biosynthesis C-methylase UbiE